MIGIILAIITPKINSGQERIRVEKGTEIMEGFNFKVNEVLDSGEGNLRKIPGFKINGGSFMVDGVEDKIVFTLDGFKEAYSEVGVPIKLGKITLVTEEGQSEDRVLLILNYSGIIDIKYRGMDSIETFDGSSTGYIFSLFHAESPGIPVVDMWESSRDSYMPVSGGVGCVVKGPEVCWNNEDEDCFGGLDNGCGGGGSVCALNGHVDASDGSGNCIATLTNDGTKDNIIVDGQIQTNDAQNFVRNDTSNLISVGGGTPPGLVQIGYIEWNTSSIPDNVNRIVKVDFVYDGTGDNARNEEIVGITNHTFRPSTTQDNSGWYTYLRSLKPQVYEGTGDSFIINSSGVTVSLNNVVLGEMKSEIRGGVDWFAVGMRTMVVTTGQVPAIFSEESGKAAKLIITYTP